MIKVAGILLAGVLSVAAVSAFAQDKPKTEDKDKVEENARPFTQLRMQVVVSEYDGDRKVSSLPYVFPVQTAKNSRPAASLRMGVRVPVVTSGAGSVTYIDVGTNIDFGASVLEDGRYDVFLVVERTSAYPSVATGDGKTAQPKSDEVQTSAQQPVIRSFRSTLNIVLKDGQTSEAAMSTDPFSGHVVRVSVTLNVVK